MAKRFFGMISLVLLLAVLFTFGGTTGAASAATISHQQAASAQTLATTHTAFIPMTCYQSNGPWFNLTPAYNLYISPCTGSSISVDVYPTEFHAEGWSGIMQARLSTGVNVQFDYCDYNDWGFASGTFIYSIYLSPTKEPWC